MGKASREHGKYYEREAVRFWKDLGYEGMERTAQRDGRTGVADIVGGPPAFHIEVKGGKVLPNVYSAVEQARRDAGPMKIPLCMLKRKYGEWVFVIPYEHIDFITRCVEHYVKERQASGRTG